MMGKSAISQTSRLPKNSNKSTTNNSDNNSNNSNISATRLSDDQSNSRNTYLFNPGRQDSISSLLNTYPSSYTTNKDPNSNQSSSASSASSSTNNQNNKIMENSYPSYYLNNRDSLPPSSFNQQNQNQQSQTQAQQSQQQVPGSTLLRPRGDSIFLPPPINSQLRSTNSSDNYDNTSSNNIPNTTTSNTNSGNSFSSRSNSIFSSLIQIPNSAGNSISEQSSNFIKNNSNSAGGTSNPNTSNPRSRQLSIFPSLSQQGGIQEQFSIEDLENLINKESLGNLMAWQQQQQQDTKSSISGGTSSGQRSKFGSIDLSLWNENANANSNNSISGLVGVPGGSISGFNGSLGDIIAGMISNGSIDLSNINEQRRDSILKFVNDSQTYRNSRIPSSELDKRHTTFNHHQQPPSVIADANTKLREDIFSKNQSGSVATINSNAKQGNADPKYKSSKASSSKLNVPEKDHLSPTSSMSSRASGKYNDEPQSPKTSPSSYNSRVQQQQQGQQQQQQQQQQFNYQRPPPPPSMYSQQQILPQPSQRMFDNYQIPGQNQYYNPNYSSPGQFQSLPPNATIRNQPPPAPTQPSANYFSSPQQLSYHQQYLPPSSYQNNQYQQQPSQNQITQEQPLDPMLAKSGNRVNKQSKSKPRKQSQSRKSRSVKSEPSIDPQQNLIPTPTNVDKGGLVTAQQYVKSEDGRPLVGATKIDQLMLVIQAREKGITNTIQQAPDGSILGSPNFSSEKGKDASVLPRPVSLVGGVDKPTKRGSIDSDEGHEEYDDEDGDGEGKNRKRRHKTQQCPHCFKTFTQSTHLEVHIRSHIGLKPFECNYCHKKFTQGGNLRTHLRLHTGEKPFPCDICHRSFNRKGNLAAHKLTHDKLKPFECKLDNCDKSFTQLGNLKSHQNRFHLNTLNSLTQKLAQLSGPALNQLPSEEKELLFYFRDLYKNSNKGIRGRGKQQPTNGNEIPGSPESNQQIPTYTGGSTSPSNMNQFRLQPQSPQHSQQQLQQTLPRQHPSTSGVAGAANVNNTGNAQQFQSIDFMNNQLANTINGYRN